MSYRETGVLTLDEFIKTGLMPPKEKLEKGPVVIIECPEEIPCNICIVACPFGAITMDKVYTLPVVDFNKCIGCGACVPKCPGLAIFIVDLSKGDKAYVTLPHEFLPKPVKNMVVKLLDREGRVIGEGRVVKVWEYDKCFVVTVEAPRDKWWEVRAIWIPEK